ncbi:hypothetical protein LCGC14_0782900 [marine sediment metagenome]|uniref:Phage head morphogenesis domain-containing protein n=1 Tax=marine sediment metagenome TaxID=412755 RepID=A0A0F9QEU5_9ZZZZ
MIPALQTQPAIPGAVLFASQPPLPRFRISTQVRKENREATRDAEKFFQALFLSHARFVHSLERELLEAGQLWLSGRVAFIPFQLAQAFHTFRVAEILAAAEVAGRLRTRRQAREEVDDLSDEVSAFAETVPRSVAVRDAVRWIRSLPAVPSDQWEAFVRKHQRAAFSIAGESRTVVIEAVRDLAAESLQSGLTPSQFSSLARDMLRQFQARPGHLRTIWNNTVSNSLRAGRYQELQRPEIRRVLPYWLFDAYQDAATRDNHRAMDGGIAPLGWSGWARYGDPLGHQCRCSRSAITAVRAEGLIASGMPYKDLTVSIPAGAGPDPGFTKFPI